MVHLSTVAASLRPLVAEYGKAVALEPDDEATSSAAHWTGHVAEAFLLAATRLKLFRVSNSPVLDDVEPSPWQEVRGSVGALTALATASAPDRLARDCFGNKVPVAHNRDPVN